MLQIRSAQMAALAGVARVEALNNLKDWLLARYGFDALGPDLDPRVAQAVGEAEALGLRSRADVYLYADLTLGQGFALQGHPDLRRVCADPAGPADQRMLRFLADQPFEFWQASRRFGPGGEQR